MPIPKTFPSPYGDYGSYRIDHRDERPQRTAKFPSPYGDYGSYQHEFDERSYNYV